MTKRDIVQHIRASLNEQRCDGLFLSDINYLGIPLPVEKLLNGLNPSRPPFVVIDGAQALHQRSVQLTALPCDLYLAGTQKWFGAYHPLRIAFTGREAYAPTIVEVANRQSHVDSLDALFDFCHEATTEDSSYFGQTANISPLISAAGALDVARQQVHGYQILQTNSSSLDDWIDDCYWRLLAPQHSFSSGILSLIPTPRPGVARYRVFHVPRSRARGSLQARSLTVLSACPCLVSISPSASEPSYLARYTNPD